MFPIVLRDHVAKLTVTTPISGEPEERAIHRNTIKSHSVVACAQPQFH